MQRLHCIILLLALHLHCSLTEPGGQQLLKATPEREKRGTVTLDFGLLLRNLVQKSAQLSSVKANITRNIIASKTTPRPPAKTTTTTTAAPLPPPPTPRRRPRPYPWWTPRSQDYYPFDYDADYGYAPPESPPPPAPLPTPPPAPPVAVPRRMRPLSSYYAQKPAQNAPYDYDYDYDGNGGAAAAPPPPPPRPRPRLRPQPPPPPPPQPQTEPSPPPSLPRRPRPRPRPRPQATAQLNDQLIYQYAQPDDTYFKDRSFEDDAAAAEDAAEDADAGDNPSDNNVPNANNQADIDKEQQNEVNPGRFLFKYIGESPSDADYYAQGEPTRFNPFDVTNPGAQNLGFSYFNSYATPQTHRSYLK